MNYDTIRDALGYECTPNLGEEQARAGARVLRENPEILPALRLRLAQLQGTRSTLVQANEDIRGRLRKIAGR